MYVKEMIPTLATPSSARIRDTRECYLSNDPDLTYDTHTPSQTHNTILSLSHTVAQG